MLSFEILKHIFVSRLLIDLNEKRCDHEKNLFIQQLTFLKTQPWV